GADRGELCVDQSIDSGDEEGRDGMDLRDVVPGSPGPLETAQVRVDHLTVARQTEDERHIHADARSNRVTECLEALDGGGYLDHRVRAVDALPELLRLSDGARSVTGQHRRDLNRDPAVTTRGDVEDRSEYVTGISDVCAHQL